MRGAGIVTVADRLIEVELLPDVGARMHRLRVLGHDLLRTPDDASAYARDPFRWGAYIMAPWCNRIDAAPTVVDDQLVALAPNFEDGTAIHGQVHSARWEQHGDADLRVQGGGDGWPWRYECGMRMAVIDTTLMIEQTLTNLAETRMPGGIGLHPWFRRPLELGVDAQHVLAANSDPICQVAPVAGSLDLRSARRVPADLDATWLDPGDPAVELRWPGIDIAASLRARSSVGTCIVVASPARLDAVAVEPQTHAPHGLRRLLRGEPGAMSWIEPGHSIRLEIELVFALAEPVPGALASKRSASTAGRTTPGSA